MQMTWDWMLNSSSWWVLAHLTLESSCWLSSSAVAPFLPCYGIAFPSSHFSSYLFSYLPFFLSLPLMSNLELSLNHYPSLLSFLLIIFFYSLILAFSSFLFPLKSSYFLCFVFLNKSTLWMWAACKCNSGSS